MNRIRFALAGLILAALPGATGCATGIVAKEKTDETAGAEGLRYFLPAPFLVLERTNDGKWDARLELGVDRTREFYVQPYAILAKGTTTVNFHEDGTLKSFKLEADSTIVPESLVTAMKELELKRLELEKAAMEEAARKRQERGDSKGEALRGESDRNFAVYRIHGDQVVGVTPNKPVKVADGSMPIEPGTADPKSSRHSFQSWLGKIMRCLSRSNDG